MRIRMPKAALLLVMAVSSAILTQGQQPPASKNPEPPKPAATSELPPADSPAAPVDPKSYKIGTEDVVQIRVWRENELSLQAVVRPDGKITLPLGGELQVGDLTLEQVRDKVVEVYSKFVNKPEVSVSLTRVSSRKYYLVGKVQRTGMFPLVVPTTVMEAINAAGGFQEFANKKKVVILRGEKRLKFNYEEVTKGKNMTQNILLENGDHIIVD